MKTIECQNYLLLKQVITRIKHLQINRLCLPDNQETAEVDTDS